jgi:hypothetical protein
MPGKKAVFFIAGLALLIATTASAQQNRTGKKTTGISKPAEAAQPQAQSRGWEATIYLRSGDIVTDRIVDMSSTRLVIQTAGSGEFALNDIWMVNFESADWNFTEERSRLRSGQHGVFLRDGGVLLGRVIDFSSRELTFELQSGEKISPDRISRIYFSNQMPSNLQGQGHARGGGTGNRGSGRDVSGRVNQGIDITGIWMADGGGTGARSGQRNVRGFQLQLDQDGAASLTFRPNGGRQSTLTGRWSFKRDDNAIVIVEIPSSGKTERLTFGRDGDLLIGIEYNKNAYGTLSLRRALDEQRSGSGLIRR